MYLTVFLPQAEAIRGWLILAPAFLAMDPRVLKEAAVLRRLRWGMPESGVKTFCLREGEFLSVPTKVL